MRKTSILKRKIIRAYNNKHNREYSLWKGYPKETYFGYESLKDCIKSTIKSHVSFYGKGLRYWKF